MQSLPFVTSLRRQALTQLPEEAIERSAAMTNRLLQQLEAALLHQEFVPHGVRTLSLADIALFFAVFPIFHATSRVHSQFTHQFPSITRWFNALSAHKHIVKGLTEAGVSDASAAAVESLI